MQVGCKSNASLVQVFGLQPVLGLRLAASTSACSQRSPRGKFGKRSPRGKRLAKQTLNIEFVSLLANAVSCMYHARPRLCMLVKYRILLLCIALASYLHRTCMMLAWYLHHACTIRASHLHDPCMTLAWHLHDACITLAWHLHDTCTLPTTTTIGCRQHARVHSCLTITTDPSIFVSVYLPIYERMLCKHDASMMQVWCKYDARLMQVWHQSTASSTWWTQMVAPDLHETCIKLAWHSRVDE